MMTLLTRLFGLAYPRPPAPAPELDRADVNERRAMRKAASLERARWAAVLQDPLARRNFEFAVALLQNSNMPAERIIACLGQQPYRPIGAHHLTLVAGGAEQGYAASTST